MIKIDDVIEHLIKIREEHGNLPILIYENGFGGHASHFASFKYTEEYFGTEEDLQENEEPLDEEEINFLVNSPKNEHGDNKVIYFESEGMIYST